VLGKLGRAILYVLVVSLLFILSACQTQADNDTELILNVENSNPVRVLLFKLDFDGKGPQLIDSASISDLKQTLVFKIKNSKDALIQVQVNPYLPSLYVVNDSENIQLDVNVNHFISYEVMGSAASDSLSKLHSRLFPLLQRLEGEGQNKKRIDSLFAQIEKEYLHCAMTAKHPSVALFAANNCRFDQNMEGLKRLIHEFTRKFPASSIVMNYVNESKKYISTIENEFQVGDTLPVFKTKDVHGRLIPIGAEERKYYFYDFFLTLNKTAADIKLLKELRENFATTDVQIYSFPMDPDSLQVASFIRKHNLKWPHVSDYEAWQGEIPAKYYLDSIPYNFLTDRHGKIILKNESLDKVKNTLTGFFNYPSTK
jgi:hypothetical protein